MYINSNLDIISNLTTYQPKYMALRILGVSLTAIILFFIINLISKDVPLDVTKLIFSYLMVIGALNCVFEGNLIALKLMNRSKKLSRKILVRALIIISTTTVVSLIWISLADMFFAVEEIFQYGITQITILGGVLIAIIQLLVIFVSKLANEWLISKKENEELKQAKLLSDYNLLKDRLNPHFLFNNLSVLKSLIHYNPAEAEIFTQNFTNVYRYVLKSHEEKLVPLQEELKFLESYIALHKERIGEGLFVDFSINKDDYVRKIPPLSLQLLVENAIKHNVANKLRPLHISISTQNQQLIVKNNLNRKDTTYSTHTGLKTLRAQYKLIANQEISILEDKKYYTVKLALL